LLSFQNWINAYCYGNDFGTGLIYVKETGQIINGKNPNNNNDYYMREGSNNDNDSSGLFDVIIDFDSIS